MNLPQGDYPVISYVDSNGDINYRYDYAREVFSQRRMAEERGAYHKGTYDTSLPIEWARDVYKMTGIWPSPWIVWGYPTGCSRGYPAPISPQGGIILTLYRTAQSADTKGKSSKSNVVRS